jgi:methionyl aminopeptidase
MSIESESDVRGLRAVGRVVSETLARLQAHARAGITTGELDDIASLVFREHGARAPDPRWIMIIRARSASA